MSGQSLAVTDAEIIELIRAQPIDVERINTVVNDVEFNPYKTINGVSIYNLAKRYENSTMVMALEARLAERSDVNLKSLTSLQGDDLLDKLTEDPNFSVSNVNLLIALNDPDSVRKYIARTIGSEFSMNKADANGNTPLKTAMLTSDVRGRHEMLSLLAEYGVDLDAKNIGEQGDTAILYACRQDLPLDMFTLMGLGANWLEESETGENILDVSQNTLICKQIMNKLTSNSNETN